MLVMVKWLNGMALHWNLSQCYRAAPAIWDQTVLPACYPTQVNVLCHNPSQADQYSIYLD